MSIAEFLLARIQEDEEVARAAAMEVPQTRSEGEVWGVWIGAKWYQSTAYAKHVATHDPSRVLAECAAKRKVVYASRLAVEHGGEEGQDLGGYVLRCLALPYAGHPDYLDEWEPEEWAP